MKTLRDVVAKRDPDMINPNLLGGVWGCPARYAYLCDDSSADNCVQLGVEDCSRCWSRAYKPKENPSERKRKEEDERQITDIMEKIEELQTKIIALKEDFENLYDKYNNDRNNCDS